MEPLIIEAHNVRKIYRSGQLRVEALRGIDIAVAEGEMVAIMGTSGCGKTTLLNCLAGLDTIDEGDIFIQGDNIRDLSDSERTAYRARHMGLSFRTSTSCRCSPPLRTWNCLCLSRECRAARHANTLLRC